MLKIDISNVWGSVEFGDLMSIEKEVAAAHAALADGSGAGSDFLGWMNLPTREATAEITGTTDIGGTGVACGFDVCIEAVDLPSTFQNWPPLSCSRAPTATSAGARVTPRFSTLATA